MEINLNKYLKLYFVFTRVSLMRFMENRIDFIMRFITASGFFLMNVIFINFLYGKVNNVAGWNKDEMLLLLGTYNIVQGVFFGFFIHNLARINRYVNKGDLDLYLIKPVNSQFFISTREMIDFAESFPFLLGIILVFTSVSNLHLQVSTVQVLIYIILIINSIILAYSMWFITVTFSFFVGRLPEIHEFFLSLFGMAKYPVNIYRGLTRMIFTFIIPIGIFVMIPSQILIGTQNFSFVFISLIIGVIFLFLSNWFWNFSLKHYSSASS